MSLIKEAQLALQGLKITPEMLRQARGNKMHVIVGMNPEAFLKLTTRTNDVEWFRKNCKSLSDYNQWAEEGETIVMPLLNIDVQTGQIKGHEGRHRAAALICARAKEIPISIRMRNYTDEQRKKYGHFKADYQMKFEDLPDYIHGQYGQGTIDKKDLRVIIDGWENIDR